VQKRTYLWPRLRAKGASADRRARDIRLVIFIVLELSARGREIKNETYPHTTPWSLRRLGRNIYYFNSNTQGSRTLIKSNRTTCRLNNVFIILEIIITAEEKVSTKLADNTRIMSAVPPKFFFEYYIHETTWKKKFTIFRVFFSFRHTTPNSIL